MTSSRGAIQELRSRGLRSFDIAAALDCSPAAVERLLGDTAPGSTRVAP
jgi:predicted transcriptional regulator